MRYCALTLAGCALLIVSGGEGWRAVASGNQDTPVSIEPRLRFGSVASGRPNAVRSNFQTDSNLVLVPVNVVDLRDHQVVGLSRDQFKVYDNDNEQLITHFASDDAPVSVAIVFDASASMGRKLSRSREAVADLLRGANPEDEFALIQFNGRVQRTVDLTDRIGEVLNGLALIEPRGQTALLDAIYMGVNTMKRARHPRKAVILISDGGDNSSRYNLVEIRQIVREADVRIFAMAIVEPFNRRVRTAEEFNGPELLRSITDETGGRMFTVDSADELGPVTAEIGATLRHEYLIGYSPAQVTRDGKYHRVTVKLEGLSGFRLFWRLGYFAPGTF